MKTIRSSTEAQLWPQTRDPPHKTASSAVYARNVTGPSLPSGHVAVPAHEWEALQGTSFKHNPDGSVTDIKTNTTYVKQAQPSDANSSLVPPPLPFQGDSTIPTAPAGDGRQGLLAAIRKGKSLNKAKGPANAETKPLAFNPSQIKGVRLRGGSSGKSLEEITREVLQALTEAQVNGLFKLVDANVATEGQLVEALHPLDKKKRGEFLDGLTTGTSDFLIYKQNFLAQHVKAADTEKPHDGVGRKPKKKKELSLADIQDSLKTGFYNMPKDSLKNWLPGTKNSGSFEKLPFVTWTQAGEKQDLPETIKAKKILEKYFESDPFLTLSRKAYDQLKGIPTAQGDATGRVLRCATQKLPEFFAPLGERLKKLQGIKAQIKALEEKTIKLQKRIALRSTQELQDDLKIAEKELSRLRKQIGQRHINAFSKRNLDIKKQVVTLGDFNDRDVFKGRQLYKQKGDALKSSDYKAGISAVFTPLTPYEATRTVNEWGNFNPSEPKNSPESVILYWKILLHAASECLSGDGHILPDSQHTPISGPKRSIPVKKVLTDEGNLYTYNKRLSNGKEKKFTLTKAQFERVNEDPKASFRYELTATEDKRVRKKATTAEKRIIEVFQAPRESLADPINYKLIEPKQGDKRFITQQELEAATRDPKSIIAYKVVPAPKNAPPPVASAHNAVKAKTLFKGGGESHTDQIKALNRSALRKVSKEEKRHRDELRLDKAASSSNDNRPQVYKDLEGIYRFYGDDSEVPEKEKRAIKKKYIIIRLTRPELIARSHRKNGTGSDESSSDWEDNSDDE